MVFISRKIIDYIIGLIILVFVLSIGFLLLGASKEWAIQHGFVESVEIIESSEEALSLFNPDPLEIIFIMVVIVLALIYGHNQGWFNQIA